jgi:hypothetical protein
MAKRQVFFSFHYDNDSWRASQVRNMGKVDESSTFSDNDWEEVKEKSDEKVKEWINGQLDKRSCLVLLIGEKTSGRKWINYEIQTAYSKGKGIVGIYIHNLKDSSGEQSEKGNDPFYLNYTKDGHRLSDYVARYDAPYKSSDYVYDDTKDHIEKLIEDAVAAKGTY